MKTLLTKEYTYNGKVVEFLLGQDVMINATEMAAVFDKRLTHFTDLKSTQDWIKWLEKTSFLENRGRDSRLRFANFDDFEGEIQHRSRDLVPILIVKKGGQDGGVSWMHRYLALELAMWLDIEFKGWVMMKIDQLLFNYSIVKSNVALQKRDLESERARLYEENMNNPTVQRIAEINEELRELKNLERQTSSKFSKDLFSDN